MHVKKVTLEDFYSENKKILESSNVNFLFGAGISSHILRTLSDIEELFEYNNVIIDTTSTSTTKRIQIEALLYWKYFIESIYPLFSVEDSDKKTHVSEISKLLRYIYLIIDKKKDSNLEKQINLFTTNYDIFFEEAIEEANLYYNDGFVGRISPIFDMASYNISLSDMSNLNFKRIPKTFFNIFKIHGSINWGFNGKKIDYDYNYLNRIEKFYNDNSAFFEEEFPKLNKLYENKNFINKPTHEKYEEIKRLFDNKKVIDYKSFIKNYKRTFAIVNPTKNKFQETLLNLNYHEMLRLYSTNLEREHVSLFVFGFSFSDEHILNITQRSLINPELKIIVFAYNTESLNQYEEIFSRVNSRNSITVVYLKDDNLNIGSLISFYEKLVNELYKGDLK